MARVADLRPLNQLWWIGIVQGSLAAFFGVTALFWPGLTLITLVYLFSAFLLGWGLMEIIQGIMSYDRRSSWWLTLLFGLVGLGVGVYLIRHPDVSFRTFIVLIGLTLVLRGISDLVRAFLEAVGGATRMLLSIIGVAALAAGIVILLQPVAGGVAFVWVLGLYALIFGSLMIAMSIELHDEFQSIRPRTV